MKIGHSVNIDLFDLYEEEMPLLKENELLTYLEKLFPVRFRAFKKGEGPTYLLWEEWEDLTTVKEPLPLEALAFLHQWEDSLVVYWGKDSITMTKLLLRKIFIDFLESEAMEVICKRFEMALEELLGNASEKSMIGWLILWVLEVYPAIGLFFFGKQRTLPFEILIDIPFTQLVRYLPKFVFWNLNAYLDAKKRRWMLYHLGIGKNIREIDNLPVRLSKKAAHHFTNAPYQFSLAEAIWYGMVLGRGGQASLAADFYHVFNNRFQDYVFFDIIIVFFTNYQKQYQPGEMRRLLGYLQHLRDEQAEFSLKGWTMNSLRRRANAWYETLQQRRYVPPPFPDDTSWNGAPYRPLYLEINEVEYLIVQLKTIYDLRVENKTMKHCVLTYTQKCIQGKSSIWSLRKYELEEEKRLLTIEVNKKKEIVQVRGAYNAKPDNQYLKIIKQWAKTEQLKFVKC